MVRTEELCPWNSYPKLTVQLCLRTKISRFAKDGRNRPVEGKLMVNIDA